MSRLKGYRDGMFDRVPQEHKDKAGQSRLPFFPRSETDARVGDYKERGNEQVHRAKEWFTEEYFPEERRDQFIYRMKKVVIECQKHSDYQESIRWLLGYLEEYARHAKSVS